MAVEEGDGISGRPTDIEKDDLDIHIHLWRDLYL
jgi:hypothetical protein